ncbi:MAG: chromate transporter, partial [Myxococcales bacterium]|nr:chromate transporter [Myxococcales bacterium]
MSDEPRGEITPSRGTVPEVGLAFLKLGLTSFGGPVAHLGYFRDELVVRRKWLDDAEYGDVVALCQFLPGPASSQVVFALGMRRAGLAGALAGSLAFTLPSALAMIAFAYGAADLRRVLGSGFLHGLKLAAVVVVAQAVWGMGKKLCTDRARLTITLMSAAVLLARPSAVTQIAVLVGAALVGYRLFRAETKAAPAAHPSRAPRAAIAALVLALGLLAVLPALASWTGLRQVAMVDAFYRSGSLVFGGGHVVLPLL